MNGRIRFLAFNLLFAFVFGDVVISQAQVSPRRPTSDRSTSDAQRAKPRASARTNAIGPQRAPGNRSNVQVASNEKRSGGTYPPGFPLSSEKQDRVDRILGFWEMNTGNVKTFRAKYKRIEFDPVMGPQGKPSMFAFGLIKYATPDKGLMRDERLYVYNPAPKEDEKEYVLTKQQIGEDWVCDGTAIFLKEPKQKLLIERQLPPELHGKAIAEGPLPFIFGAKASTMKRRFWIREVTPQKNPNGDYYLEATPKTREDAANYERIVVILDKEKDYLLPKKMEVTVRTFAAQPRAGQAAPKVQKRVDIYEFTERKVNDPNDRVRDFFAQFVKPEVPSGWKKEVRKWDLQPAGNVAGQAAPNGQIDPVRSGPPRTGETNQNARTARSADRRSNPRLLVPPRK